MKQTAVEWLVEELTRQNMFMHLFAKEIEQAKEIEKEQITDSYIMGSYDMAAKEFRPEQYYNETYKESEQ
jgi:hypothetical protein